MSNKKIKVYVTHFVVFMAGAIFSFTMIALLENYGWVEQKKAYDTINHALAMKLNYDISYKQFCSDNGFRKIEDNWPSDANAFHVAINDHFFGSYECKVFFDTGDVFYLETSRYKDGINKVTFFEKLKWPDRKAGENVWQLEQFGKL